MLVILWFFALLRISSAQDKIASRIGCQRKKTVSIMLPSTVGHMGSWNLPVMQSHLPICSYSILVFGNCEYCNGGKIVKNMQFSFGTAGRSRTCCLMAHVGGIKWMRRGPLASPISVDSIADYAEMEFVPKFAAVFSAREQQLESSQRQLKVLLTISCISCDIVLSRFTLLHTSAFKTKHPCGLLLVCFCARFSTMYASAPPVIAPEYNLSSASRSLLQVNFSAIAIFPTRTLFPEILAAKCLSSGSLAKSGNGKLKPEDYISGCARYKNLCGETGVHIGRYKISH